MKYLKTSKNDCREIFKMKDSMKLVPKNLCNFGSYAFNLAEKRNAIHIIV